MFVLLILLHHYLLKATISSDLANLRRVGSGPYVGGILPGKIQDALKGAVADSIGAALPCAKQQNRDSVLS